MTKVLTNNRVLKPQNQLGVHVKATRKVVTSRWRNMSNNLNLHIASAEVDKLLGQPFLCKSKLTTTTTHQLQRARI